MHRLLLLNFVEKRSPLRGRSNASRLSCLFWGNNTQLVYLALWLLSIFWMYGGWHNYTTEIGDCSICLNLSTMSPCCIAAIQSIRVVWMKWGNIFSEYHRALLVDISLSISIVVICPKLCIWFCIRYACPLCSKSVCDMSKVWEKIDLELAATPMPEPYLNKMVSIPFRLVCIDLFVLIYWHKHLWDCFRELLRLFYKYLINMSCVLFISSLKQSHKCLPIQRGPVWLYFIFGYRNSLYISTYMIRAYVMNTINMFVETGLFVILFICHRGHTTMWMMI